MEVQWKWTSYSFDAHNRRESQEVQRKNIHMDHETSPLFDTKMPKAKPIVKLMDTYLRNIPR